MRRRKSSFGKRLRRMLLTLLIVAGLGFLGYRLFLYQQGRATYPVGTTVAGLDAGGKTRNEVAALLDERFLRPVILYHRDERVELDPLEVGFNLEVNTMLDEADQAYAAQNYWLGFAQDLVGWTWDPIKIPLQAGYDPGLLREMLETVGRFLDKPGTAPQILSETGLFAQGESGFVTDVDASLPIVERALYSAEEREAELVIVDQEAPTLDFDFLEAVIRKKLTSFGGMGSIFVMDLQTGDEIRINADVAMSGLSILKIGIFMEAYRHLELPLNDYEEQLFLDTATRSSNYAANLLLHIVAGEDNTYKGADMLTESLWRLGLKNTFMAVPYDATPPEYRKTTYTTPANSRTDINTFPDPTMQSTADDIGSLLAMIYYCANGGGTLLAVYPNDLTPEECQEVIDLMVLNEEGNLIRFGVPDGVPVSHKHGWAQGTHADAGIVLSPGGDYVLVEYLHQNGEWLQSAESFPILREISRAVYNYFNWDEPYLGDALTEEERFDEGDAATDLPPVPEDTPPVDDAVETQAGDIGTDRGDS